MMTMMIMRECVWVSEELRPQWESCKFQPDSYPRQMDNSQRPDDDDHDDNDDDDDDYDYDDYDDGDDFNG